MKSTFTLPLLFLLLNVQCQNSQAAKDTGYFEGEIHFTVSYQSLDSRMPNDFFDQYMGNKMIGKVKENKYLTFHDTKGEQGWTKMLYLLEEGIGYLLYEKVDTVYQFSLEANPGELIDFQRNQQERKVVLGDSCESVFIHYLPSQNTEWIKAIRGTYYFNPKYKLNPVYYKKHKASFWDRFVAETGAISVRNEIENFPIYKSLYEAVEIIEKEIPEEEFVIDKNRPIKMIE